jgi:serine/threonine protein kinase
MPKKLGKFEKYTEIKALGQGSFGDVYLAKNVYIPNKYFVIKRVAENLEGEREVYFLRRLGYLCDFINNKSSQFYEDVPKKIREISGKYFPCYIDSYSTGKDIYYHGI